MANLSLLRSLLPLLLILLVLYVQNVTAGTIVQHGNKLYDSETKQRFFVQGIAYGYSADVADTNSWKLAIDAIKRDAPEINTVRIYAITANDSLVPFLDYLQNNSLYAIVPITPYSPSYCALDRNGYPELSAAHKTCYPTCLLNEAQKIVRQIGNHPAVLAFGVANEVMNNRETWQAAPCVKAFTADIKRYMSKCGMRHVPMMYAAADNPVTEAGLSANDNDRLKLDYLACGEPDTAIDIFGLNVYRWCNADCVKSADACQMGEIAEAFWNSSIPVIFSESGCIPFFHGAQGGQRDFSETALYYGYHDGLANYTFLTQADKTNESIGSKLYALMHMTDFLNGAVAYEAGARGGQNWALYTGNGLDIHSPFSDAKACGAPDGMCAIDMYHDQLHKIAEHLKKLGNNDMLGESKLNFSDSSISARSCPISPFPEQDWSVPASRMYAAGYDEVLCPSGLPPSNIVTFDSRDGISDNEDTIIGSNGLSSESSNTTSISNSPEDIFDKMNSSAAANNTASIFDPSDVSSETALAPYDDPVESITTPFSKPHSNVETSIPATNSPQQIPSQKPQAREKSGATVGESTSAVISILLSALL